MPPKFEILEGHATEPGTTRHSLRIPFEWLYHEKRVRKILQVSCNDVGNAPHSDMSIEEVLGPLGVEELDWRKLDICPRTVHRIGGELRTLYLYWGGNNAILRAWSEPGGLPRLPCLQRVFVYVMQVR